MLQLRERVKFPMTMLEWLREGLINSFVNNDLMTARYSSIALLYIGLVKSALLDTTSFLSREKALQEYSTGYNLLQSDPKQAAEHYARSYELLANPLAARKLAWLHEMLGNHKQIWEWQQNYVRNDIDSVLMHMNEGIRRHYAGEYANAIDEYELAYEKDPANPDALYLKGVSYQHLGDIQNAASSYYAAIELDPMHTKAILNLATLHQKYGSFDVSIAYYLKGTEAFQILENGPNIDGKHQYLHPHHVMLQYNLGLAYYQRNELDKAYNTTIQLINRLLPIAQAVGDPLLVSSQQALQAHDIDVSLYDTWEITQSMGGALGSLSKIQRAALYWGKWEELNDQLVKYTLLGIAHSTADSGTAIDTTAGAEVVVNTKIVYSGPLLPFDTLMMQLPLSTKLFIAQSASLQYTHVPYDASKREAAPLQCTTTSTSSAQHMQAAVGAASVGSVEHPQQQQITALKCNRKLKLGFISYDFNDHPTAHLVEAIFQIINTHVTGAQINTQIYAGAHNISTLYDHVELVIFSYGKDDNSIYRNNLRNLAHKFVDIVESTFTTAAETIQAENIDILLDLQIHTLGSRLEITAAGVAPVVVNYLVYPGTSGATFYNYVICDSTVVPAEHSAYYSEALLMLPPTYQISTYVGFIAQREALAAEAGVLPGASVGDTKMALRRRYGLPQHPEAIIFCNFNKINKIDPESFALWVQVLREVPSSYLWLLDPSKEGDHEQTSTKATLLRSFIAAGVAEKRILFARRVGKNAHIYRHGAADLFLDTIVYGAHSTATDALMGGLPVLTLCGDSFPSRVAASLYQSFAYRHAGSTSSGPALSAAEYVNSVLVVDSAKDFVDTAVRLVRTKHDHSSIASRLAMHVHGLIAEQAGLFDAERNVRTFVYGMEAVQEAAALKDILPPAVGAVSVGIAAPLTDYYIVIL